MVSTAAMMMMLITMFRLITGSRGERGGRFMMSGSPFSSPRARAGAPSVTRFNHKSMIGLKGTVTRRIDPTGPPGTVALQGSLWTARSDIPIEAGETIQVVAVDGIKLTVAKTTQEV